jgi:hypothetical protein
VGWDDVRQGWDEIVASVDDHRPWADSIPRARRLWLRRANIPIAVTGRPGAGKTVLYDALAGRVGGLGYRTTRSKTAERHRALLGAKRTAMLVVPGQESKARKDALDTVFGQRRFQPKSGPVGVVHVVCWGYNKLWRRGSDEALKSINPDATEQGNERLRSHLLSEETDDFADLCRDFEQVQGRLRWLIIAVAKSDLFWPRIDEARDYYIPGRKASPFHTVLGSLTSRQHTLPEQIAVVPFSAHPESHDYADGLMRTPSTLDNLQATALRNSFYDVLEGLL